MNIAKDVTELIGNTPLVRINKFSNETKTTILGKCEFMNPSSSVKDRIALAMIDAALKDGKINEKTIIVEPTSGNTGIGLAMVCAAKGLNLTLTMPESMSMERRQLLTALGANIVLTPAATGMKGAIDRAAELDEEMPNSFMPQQFNNPANPEVHRKTSALEILKDTDGNVVSYIDDSGNLYLKGALVENGNP